MFYDPIAPEINDYIIFYNTRLIECGQNFLSDINNLLPFTPVEICGHETNHIFQSGRH